MTKKLSNLCQCLLLVLTVSPLFSQSNSGDVPERADIPDRYKWDLSSFYPDTTAWEQDLKQAEAEIKQLALMQDSACSSAEDLLEFLTLRDTASNRLDRISAYTALLRDEDMRESEPQALYDRSRSLYIKAGEATAWFRPVFLTLPSETWEKWRREVPRLGTYDHFVANLLRQRDHVLNTREEELLAMTGKLAATPQQAFSMLTNADLKFPKVEDPDGNLIELSEGRYGVLLKSSNRDFRKRVFKQIMKTYLQYRNTISATLAGSIHGDVFRARARNYDSALHAALAPDNVPIDVYKNLVATIHKHFPKLHRYIELRRRELGLEKVHIYDSFAPLIQGDPPEISYDDAVDTITKGLEPLSEEYLEPMREGFRSRWIDVYETQGKRSGAYSMGIYTVHPYMLMNFDGTYGAMFTLAHEMGHSMHTWFTQHNQPPIYGDYPIFLAEVASTCNQIILGDYLRNKAKDSSERLFLINEAIEDIRGTVITQTMWAEFEMLVHAEAEKGAPLTYDTMSAIYSDLVKTYFGPSWAHDDEVDGYWMRIPHFYRGFYVYKYATSYCAAVALADRILSKEDGALEAYLGFLKAGGSDYPIQILRKAGVDMSTPAPIDATMRLFGKLLDELEKLLDSS
jgi:oligoendopeptidase F